MVKSTILIPNYVYHKITRHLFPKMIESEEVAFLFSAVSRRDSSIQFRFKSWYGVQPKDYEYRSLEHIELKDEMRQKIIKSAFDLDTAIVEMHSHPFKEAARFSPSDLEGFDEFVPHVFWRLKGKPYSAIVFSASDFDALAWIDNPKAPEQLTEIIVKRWIWKQRFHPNGLTLKNCELKYG